MDALRRSYPMYTQGTLSLIDYNVASKSLSIEYAYDASISHPTEVYLNSDSDIKILNKETGEEIDHQFAHVDKQSRADFGVDWFKQDIKINGPHLDGA